jgi:hypothetical protein
MILNIGELSAVTFSEVLDFDIETLQVSVDGNKAILKWGGITIPNSVDNLLTKEGPYNHNEMVAILETSEWSNNN